MSEKAIEQKIIDVMERTLMGINDRYVTAEELCQHIGTLTPRFLADHGSMFDRKQLEWRDRDGHLHKQGWLYALNATKKRFLEGEFQEHTNN